MLFSDSTSIPRTVRRVDVAELAQSDERVSCLAVIFGTTIGVNEDSFDWCPDDIPPTDQETLGWLWFMQPELDKEIRCHATGQLARLMLAYEQRNLAKWWQELLEEE